MRQSDLHGDMESTAEMPVPRETDEAILEVSRSNNERTVLRLHRRSPRWPQGRRCIGLYAGTSEHLAILAHYSEQ